MSEKREQQTYKQRHRRKNAKTIIILLFAVLLLALFSFIALNDRLIIRTYNIYSPKVTASLKFVLISDLHGEYYGENQSELVKLIEDRQPNAVFYVGDMADEYTGTEPMMGLLNGLKGKFPAFYVTGNHEFWNGKTKEIKDIFRSNGVEVLEDEGRTWNMNGQYINVCGIDDPERGNSLANQLTQAFSGIDSNNYTILLSHRPELIDSFLSYSCDLILSGHAHGGQWRIPYLINGVYAPNQGLFPKYAGGLYEHGQTTHIVGRGLAGNSGIVPRIFNRPELVFINVHPA